MRLATISTALLRVPSGACHDLLRSRPSSAARSPLWRNWLHSSACLSQTEMRTKSAPPSLLARSTASTKLATRFPSASSLSSTSVARLPISCTEFTP